VCKTQRRQEPSHPFAADAQATRLEHLIEPAIPIGGMRQRRLLDRLPEVLLAPLALLTA
jgi:hypothetical protein